RTHLRVDGGRSFLRDRGLSASFFCVFLRSQKVERLIRLVADDPTVVTRRTGRNVEEGAGWTLVCRVTINRKRGAAGQNQAYVLDIAKGRPNRRSYILRPAPSRFVCSPADREPSDVNDFEPSFVKDAHLVGLLKTFQNSIHIDSSLPHNSFALRSATSSTCVPDVITASGVMRQDQKCHARSEAVLQNLAH